MIFSDTGELYTAYLSSDPDATEIVEEMAALERTARTQEQRTEDDS